MVIVYICFIDVFNERSLQDQGIVSPYGFSNKYANEDSNDDGNDEREDGGEDNLVRAQS